MARRVLVPPATPSAANFSFLSRSRGSSSSNKRAAANPSDALASPVAQMSISRCSVLVRVSIGEPIATVEPSGKEDPVAIVGRLHQLVAATVRAPALRFHVPYGGAN